MVYARSQKNEVYYIYVYVSSRVSDSPSEYDDDTIDDVNINRCRQGLAMVFMCGVDWKKKTQLWLYNLTLLNPTMRITFGVGIIVGANFIAGHVISVVLGEDPFLFDNYIFDNSPIFAYNKSLLIMYNTTITIRLQF